VELLIINPKIIVFLEQPPLNWWPSDFQGINISIHSIFVMLLIVAPWHVLPRNDSSWNRTLVHFFCLGGLEIRNICIFRHDNEQGLWCLQLWFSAFHGNCTEILCVHDLLLWLLWLDSLISTFAPITYMLENHFRYKMLPLHTPSCEVFGSPKKSFPGKAYVKICRFLQVGKHRTSYLFPRGNR